MKSIFLTVLLFSFPLAASDYALEGLSIRNASFQYNTNSGQLTADTAIAKLKGMELQMVDGQIDLSQNERGFDISYQNVLGTFEIEDESLFNTMGMIDLQGLSLDLETQQKIHFNIANFAVEVGDGMQELVDVRMLCQRGARKMLDSLILPCLEDGSMSIKSINLAASSEDTVSKAVGGRNSSVGSLDNFYIKITNKKFTAQLYTTIIIRLKVSLEGSLDYIESKNEFKLQVTKAKAGWFNVKSRLLDAIKDAGLEGLRVEGDSIYFSL